MTDGGGLKLRARDPRDLDVIAALLQDALVPLNDVIFLKRDKRFIMVVNRFKWPQAEDETGPAASAAGPKANQDAAFEDADGEPPYARVNCGVCFDRVQRVRTKEIDLSDRQQILNLMTITSDAKAITLLFSGGAAIRLEVSALNCHIEDLGEGWLTRWRPAHDDAEVEKAATEATAPDDSSEEETRIG